MCDAIMKQICYYGETNKENIMGFLTGKTLTLEGGLGLRP